MRYEMRHAMSFIIVKGFGGVDKNIQMIYCTVLCVLTNALSQSGSFKRSKACNRNKIVSHSFLFFGGYPSSPRQRAAGWGHPCLSLSGPTGTFLFLRVRGCNPLFEQFGGQFRRRREIHV